MTMIDYINGKLSVSGNEEFYSASADELRVLLILLEQNRTPSPEEVAERAKVSVARAASAISYWESAGVIGTLDRRITYEFEARNEEEEAPSVEVARTIRNESLATLLTECATLLGKAALSDTEIKRIVELYERHALSEEYLITLLSDMCHSGKRVTIPYFAKKAVRLADDGIDTTEALVAYFTARDARLECENLYRSLIGEWQRALTDTERARLIRWTHEYAYGEEILRLAYNLATDAGAKRIPSYMDTLLTDWNAKNLRTPPACRADYDAGKPTHTTTERPNKKTNTRQGNFDPEEAFRLALERSYGNDNKEDC